MRNLIIIFNSYSINLQIQSMINSPFCLYFITFYVLDIESTDEEEISFVCGLVFLSHRLLGRIHFHMPKQIKF